MAKKPRVFKTYKEYHDTFYKQNGGVEYDPNNPGEFGKKLAEETLRRIGEALNKVRLERQTGKH